MPNLYPISSDHADEAVSAAAAKIRDYQFLANAYQTIAKSSLCGRVVNKSIAPRIQRLFPDWKVRYYASDYGPRWRSVALSDPDNLLRSYDIYLATSTDPRLSANYLHAQYIEYSNHALALTSALSDFPELLAQYNNLVPFLSTLYNALAPVMRASERSSW